MATPSEIKYICKRSLENIKIDTDEATIQNGLDFYKYMFTNFSKLRVYFKGAENYTADDVQQSDRFRKQGQQILLACHILANTFDDQMTFKAYTRETVNQYRQFKMDPLLWSVFFTIFVGYLGTKTMLDEATKRAWADLGKVFAKECYRHFTGLGMPAVFI